MMVSTLSTYTQRRTSNQGVQRGEVEDPITQPRWAFAVGGLQCLQFRTDQAQDLKRLEKLNQLFFALTVHGETAELGSSPHRHLPVHAALSPSCDGARQPSKGWVRSRVGSSSGSSLFSSVASPGGAAVLGCGGRDRRLRTKETRRINSTEAPESTPVQHPNAATRVVARASTSTRRVPTPMHPGSRVCVCGCVVCVCVLMQRTTCRRTRRPRREVRRVELAAVARGRSKEATASDTPLRHPKARVHS
jgi:hypothetical protein